MLVPRFRVRRARGITLGVSRAFTLIELLVVIAIIAILAAILFPVFAQARDKARQTQCVSNAKQLAMAFYQYAQDYDEHFCPSRLTNTPGKCDGNRVAAWSMLIQPYVKNLGVFQCPSDSSAGTGTAANPKRSFVVTAGNAAKATGFPDCSYPEGVMGPNWGASFAQIGTPAGMVICYERWQDGIYVQSTGAVHANLTTDWCTDPNGHQYPVLPSNWYGNLYGNWNTALTNPRSLFHQNTSTLIYGDGHAKSLRYSQSFAGASSTSCAGTLTWSMFDRNIAP